MVPAQVVYVNGVPAASTSYAQNTSTSSNPLIIGPQLSGSVDLQISDVAIWDSYAATATDIQNLYLGVYNPLNLTNGGTTYKADAWYPLTGTSGNAPSVSPSIDAGLQDWTGNGHNITTLTTTGSYATYAGVLGASPPVAVEAYASKSGKVAFFFPVQATPQANGYCMPVNVTAVPSNLTITWNGKTIEADGPVWGDQTSLPFVAYRLQCGSVQAVSIANGGTANYTSPSVTASSSDGNGTPPTLGTPMLSEGVIAYTVGGVGSYSQYTSAPSVSMTGGTYATPPSARVVLSGSTLTVVPTVGGILGCGSNVTSTPSFSLSGGVGGGATAALAMTGGLAFLTVTGIGSGYTAGEVAVTITDASGTGAAATATVGGGGPGTGATPGAVTVSGGVVTAVAVGTGGSGYTANPTVVISGSGGSGAVVTATVSGGVITGYTVAYGGSGYPTSTTTASVVCGAITGLTLTAGGSGYTSPTVSIANTSGGSGSGATASATVWTSGGIAQPLVTAGGFGYPTYGTTATIADGGSGSGAQVAVAVSGGVVTGIAPTALGSGYTSPTITIHGVGSGATATATVGAGGVVTAITPGANGSGYSSAIPPTVTISGGGGSGATATAIVSGGAVTGYAVTNSGSGYAGTPTVTVGGSGATATATYCRSGGIAAATITAAGSGYSATEAMALVFDTKGGTGSARLSATR